MPFSLRNKIVKLLNPPDVNSHDWKGLAGAMNLTADDVRQLAAENDDKGKMAGLFDKMIHTKKTINHLLALLKHKDVERWDVIDEIIKGCNLETESFDEDQESGLFICCCFYNFLTLICTHSLHKPIPNLS